MLEKLVLSQAKHTPCKYETFYVLTIIFEYGAEGISSLIFAVCKLIKPHRDQIKIAYINFFDIFRFWAIYNTINIYFDVTS